MSNDVVLRAEQIVKNFAEAGEVLPVLKGVSLEVKRGEVVSLEGPSGSGKTTLLSIIGCILTATSGTLTIEGAPIDFDRPEHLPEVRRRSIGSPWMMQSSACLREAFPATTSCLAITRTTATTISSTASRPASCSMIGTDPVPKRRS